MTGIEALQALKDGKKVRLDDWDSYDYIEIKGAKGCEYVSGPYAKSPISSCKGSLSSDSTSAVHDMLLALFADGGWAVVE